MVMTGVQMQTEGDGDGMLGQDLLGVGCIGEDWR